MDYAFVEGLNLIIGGNGVGKTTFISILKYALIGLYKKDLDVRVYKGEKRLFRKTYSNSNTFFRSRTEERDSDRTGCVELWFDIQDTSFYVKRSLYDIRLDEASYIKRGVNYVIPGNVVKQDSYTEYSTDGDCDEGNCLQQNYETIVAKEANLSDFEDFIFFVNQILLFGESRENVLWSEESQERLLSSFLNDPQLEKQRKDFALKAKYDDSIARHKQEEIKAISRVIKQLKSDEGSADNTGTDKLTLMSDIDRLKAEKERINRGRKEYQNKIGILYNKESKLSHKINEKEKERECLNSEFRKEFWPGVNPKYDVYRRQYVGNHICPICNADLAQKEIEDSIDRCFFCGTEIIVDDTKLGEIEKIETELAMLVSERNDLEKRILGYEKELKKMDSDFRNLNITIHDKQKDLRNIEGVDVKNSAQSESSYMAMMDRIDKLSMEKENASNSSERNKLECEKIMGHIEENMLEMTKSLSDFFSDFAEAFLKLPCYLSLGESPSGKKKIFIPVVDSKPRYDQDELSESQRFFVDYSFRMGILSYFYECPAFYICETPDSSLDISYEENAADTFMKFLERPNVLILTSNLNNSSFIKYILTKAPKKKVINLLKYGKISNVQKNHIMLANLSREIEEMCNEKI